MYVEIACLPCSSEKKLADVLSEIPGLTCYFEAERLFDPYDYYHELGVGEDVVVNISSNIPGMPSKGNVSKRIVVYRNKFDVEAEADKSEEDFEYVYNRFFEWCQTYGPVAYGFDSLFTAKTIESIADEIGVDPPTEQDLESILKMFELENE